MATPSASSTPATSWEGHVMHRDALWCHDRKRIVTSVSIENTISSHRQLLGVDVWLPGQRLHDWFSQRGEWVRGTVWGTLKEAFQRWKPFAPKNSRRQTSHFDSGPLLWLKTPRQQTLLGTTLLGNILKPKCNKKTLAESLRVSFIISSLSSTLSKTLGLLTHRWRPLEQRASPCWAEGHRVWCHPHGSRTET